jgi:cell division transport system permease protein
MRRIGAALWFAVHSAGQNFRRNLGVSLAGVFTMGLILFLVGGALLFTHSVDQILEQQQQAASKLSIYISDSASLAQITDFEARLQHDPRVLSVSFETKDQAAQQFAQEPGSPAGFEQLLGSNPLPASLNVTAKQLTDLQQLDQLAKNTPIVDKTTATDYNADVINTLHRIIGIITVVGVAIALILLVISLVIIMNTIRTAVYARRTEIEIMKLVGATDWFVRWPFILEGVFAGLIAAAFAGAVVIGSFKIFVHVAQRSLLSIPFDGSFTVVLLVLLTAGGVCVGAFGSYLGVRRFLAV